MRVLVVGSGGREHALVRRLAADRGVSELVAAPGNPGIAALARTVPVDAGDIAALARLAETERIDFTVIGPELPLSLGVVDRFEREGRAVIGPTSAAARLESSKAFAKDFMARHRVPTARFRVCDDIDAALQAIRSGEFGAPLVIKADGLAAGKGVVIAEDQVTAEATVHAVMRDRRFGDAGSRLVLEECLTGPEASFFVLSDGRRALFLGTAQDHKRIFDGDRGANTGGMGAFAPSPLVDAEVHARVMGEVVEPVIAGMARESCPFRGFLYVGLMLTAEGPKVIEFNARLGDPEAQVVLPLIDGELLPLLMAAADGNLAQQSCRLSADCLVGVVVASRGYPESSESNQPIEGLDTAAALPSVTVAHAGTALRDGRIVTNGGRVLTVVGRAPDFETAIARAYSGVSAIRFDGMQYRRDIGQRALAARR
jgi:phosphoribosylamine---glycine ligase